MKYALFLFLIGHLTQGLYHQYYQFKKLQDLKNHHQTSLQEKKKALDRLILRTQALSYCGDVTDAIARYEFGMILKDEILHDVSSLKALGITKEPPQG